MTVDTIRLRIPVQDAVSHLSSRLTFDLRAKNPDISTEQIMAAVLPLFHEAEERPWTILSRLASAVENDEGFKLEKKTYRGRDIYTIADSNAYPLAADVIKTVELEKGEPKPMRVEHQVPAGSVTLYYRPRRRGRGNDFFLAAEVSLGSVINHHNGMMLTPEAASDALRVYLVALKQSFPFLDVSSPVLERIDFFYQWRVHGLSSRFPAIEHTLRCMGKEPSRHGYATSTRVQVTKNSHITFYDKTKEMKAKASTHYHEELYFGQKEIFLPPDSELKKWKTAPFAAMTTMKQFYGKPDALNRVRFRMAPPKLPRGYAIEHQTEAGTVVLQPDHYDLPELDSVLRCELTLKFYEARSARVYLPDNLWDLDKCVFDGERMHERLRKHFQGLPLAPATNIRDLLARQGAPKSHWQAVVLHMMPWLEHEMLQEAKDRKNVRKTLNKIRKESPLERIAGSMMSIPTYTELREKFADCNVAWYLQVVDVHGEYLDWQVDNYFAGGGIVPPIELLQLPPETQPEVLALSV